MTQRRNALSRDVLLWSSTVLIFILGSFLVLGPRTCYDIPLCHEFSSILKIYNYALSLFVFAVSIFINGLYSKSKSIDPGNWLLFTYIWFPMSFFFSIIAGGGTNGWIPTSPGPQVIFIAFTVIYFVISISWQFMQERFRSN